MQADLICMYCKHFNGKEFTCNAFKDGIIPEIIVSGDSIHSEPLPEQDNDIVFEELKK